MASLTGKKIKDTYQSLLKTEDNEALDGKKVITDGFGNESGLSLDNEGNVSVANNLDVVVDISDKNGLISEQFETERQERIDGDANLQAQVTSNDNDIAALQQADVDFQNALDQEVADRIAGDNNLQSQIDSNDSDISALQAADIVLQQNIDAEEAARTSADTTLQENIDAEILARQDADNTLQSNIDAGAVIREGADSALDAKINTETTDRLLGDAALQSQIDDNDIDIQANVDAIAQEVIDRTNADQNLSDAIDAEEVSRIAADANLQTQIDNIESDIVDNYVPYTGASNNVDLGSNIIAANAVNLLGLSSTEGVISWNTDEHCLDVFQDGTTLQVGQEIMVQVRNNTAEDIPDGTPIYVTGTLGASGRLTAAPMIADGSIHAKYFIGVTTQVIAAGQDGKATWFGKVRSIDTSGYNEGDILYVSDSVAGQWTTTRPQSPSIALEVAIVINSKNNGTIFVRGNNGVNLSDNNDIIIDNPLTGDVLLYNGSEWTNSDALTQEIANRISADQALQANIDAEALVRQNADNVLQTNIDNEALARANEDSLLQDQINSNDADIADLYATKEDVANKGVANGYAPLDGGAKVSEIYLPDSILGQLSYQGTWDGSTNTPTLPDPTTAKGDYYVTSVAGTYLTITYDVGDWIVSNGTDWEKVDNTDAVASVFGRLGNVVANESDYSAFYPLIQDLNDEAIAREDGDNNLQDQIDNLPPPNNALIQIQAGTGISGGGNFTTDQANDSTIVINHADTSTLIGTYGSTSYGVKINTITLDDKGHVTGVTTGNTGDILGVYGQNGLTGGGSSNTVYLQHADTSTQPSVYGTGRQYIQSIALDNYGHVTSLSVATDADEYTGTVYSVSAGSGLTGGTITSAGTISHADTSSIAQWSGSNNTAVISDILFDGFGHVVAMQGRPISSGGDSNVQALGTAGGFDVQYRLNSFLTNIDSIRSFTSQPNWTGIYLNVDDGSFKKISLFNNGTLNEIQIGTQIAYKSLYQGTHDFQGTANYNYIRMSTGASRGMIDNVGRSIAMQYSSGYGYGYANDNIYVSDYGYFKYITLTGIVEVQGSFSVTGSKNFKIDHPLKPETHDLVHASVESNRADVTYRGKTRLVNGIAQVNIDEYVGMTEGTFEALTKDVQCFTNNEDGWTLVRGKVNGNILTIESKEPCNEEISWIVIGERNDKDYIESATTDENGYLILEPESEGLAKDRLAKEINDSKNPNNNEQSNQEV